VIVGLTSELAGSVVVTRTIAVTRLGAIEEQTDEPAFEIAFDQVLVVRDVSDGAPVDLLSKPMEVTRVVAKAA